MTSIIFSGASPRLILEGKKTQTRRLFTRSRCTVDGSRAKEPIWDAMQWDRGWADPGLGAGGYLKVPWVHPADNLPDEMVCRVRGPYEIGDQLWVREAWGVPGAVPRRHDPVREGMRVVYKKGDPGDVLRGWRSPIYMPRWASRITIEVMNVEAERLHDITEEDALAEGCLPGVITVPTVVDSWGASTGGGGWSARDDFEGTWDTINRHQGSLWADNPWVLVTTFRRVE